MTTHLHRRLAVPALVAMLALLAAGCGSSSSSGGNGSGGATAANTSVSGSVSVIGIWTGDEQKSFQAVIDAFNKTYPNVKVKYTSAGDNVPTVVGTAVQGGNPPDIATIAQPGLIKQFQAKGALKPLDYVRSTLSANYAPDYLKLGSIGGKLYSFVFKGANKSTVWFNVASYKNAGVTPAATWAAFVKDAKTLKASGTPAYSIGGADGWTLTDLFENLYLRQAGGAKYDALTQHQIKWTDPSVKTTLRTMAQIFGDTSNIVGGTSGALQTDFPGSVENVFTTSPKGAEVMEGDFVPGVVSSKTTLKPKTGYDVFPFPAVGAATNAVVGGGDSITTFRDTPAIRAFVKFLASRDGAEAWARRGGFSSPNKAVPASAYPDDITRTVATAVANAKTFRFDMSDLEPAAFGGTPGQGEWKILQDFLAKPSNVNGTASALESAAAKAFKG